MLSHQVQEQLFRDLCSNVFVFEQPTDTPFIEEPLKEPIFLNKAIDSSGVVTKSVEFNPN